MRHYKNPRHNNRRLKYLAVGITVGVLGIGMTAGVLTMAGNHTVTQTTASSTQDADEITYKGITYVPKGNLETYLFAGIDSPDKVTELKEYDGTGQCDVLIVLVRDRSTDGKYGYGYGPKDNEEDASDSNSGTDSSSQTSKSRKIRKKHH